MDSTQKNGKPKILITEDDLENQKFLNLILKRNFEVDVCDSEATFFEKLSENHYNVILMDVSLNGERSGVEIIRDLKKHPAYKSTPVVCLSAHVFSQVQRDAMDAGADAYLTKPVHNYELIDTLTKLVNREAVS
ncbi:MAG: response regulator [Ignavibacteriaceae bacterium]|nr:response regulator [Ignavibacteriaceae bacterium]